MHKNKKALILIDHGSRVNEANSLLEDIAAKIIKSNNCDFDIVTYSHMELAEPTIKQAFKHCIDNGATDIVVHPYFLSPGRHSKTDIPEMVSDAAKDYPWISYHVTEPLGVHEKIIEVVLERSKNA